jgi:hypothetical protein
MTKEELKDVSYLGDGVYIGHDGYQLWLFLSNGIGEHSFIAIEPYVIESLRSYVDKYLTRAV